MMKEGKPVFQGKYLLKYQLSEYISSFFVQKYVQSRFNMLAIVSGAFGAFRREMLYEINGYKKTIGEDMEITLHIQKYMAARAKQYRMVFIPQAVCYTEAPESIRDIQATNPLAEGVHRLYCEIQKRFRSDIASNF